MRHEPAATSSGPMAFLDGLTLPAFTLSRGGELAWQNRRCAQDYGLAGESALLADLSAAGREGLEVTAELAHADGSRRGVTLHLAPLLDAWLVLVDESPGGIARAQVEALRARIAELERLSTTDRLTGLGNRLQMERSCAQEMARAARDGSAVSLILVDIDHFKRVNDSHGHAHGDAVLQAVATCLRSNVRPGDEVFRWGGEEFLVLAPATTAAVAGGVAERLRAAVESARPGGLDVTVSAGVATLARGETREAWFGRVDKALYRAKETGRNRVVVDAQGAAEAAAAAASALQLVWSSTYASGHALIDDEHRALFAKTNELLATAARGLPIDAVMQQLLDEIAAHFRDEERVLEECGYPGLTGHRAQHRRLLAQAARLRRAVTSGRAGVARLVDFVALRVVNQHILQSDRLYFPCVAGRAAAAA